MGFACQKDSYLKSFTTKVKSCQAATYKELVKGKNVEISGFEVLLEDTILFPEGGGQADDRGTINEIAVVSVSRRASEAIHFTMEEVSAGEEVVVTVDWPRRWDHMQQHSGQHLISALATSLFKFNTTAWNLGDKTSFIELDTQAMTQVQMDELEVKCNNHIRTSTPVNILTYPDQHHPKVKELQSRGFPEDLGHSEVRVVCIEGVDENPCCGTHVSNLAHLQAIKLLGVDKGKKGKVQTSLKIQQKNNLSLLREVAMFEAERLNNEKPRYYSVHKKEGDQDFMNVLVSNSPKETLLFVTTGDEKGVGMFVLSGPEEAVKSLGEGLMQAMQGKGAFTGGRYQGRVMKMAARGVVEENIKKYLNL